VNLVRIINGRHFVSGDQYRAVTDVTFPLVDAEVQKNRHGTFIVVDGVPVRGFPKRNFKLYVDGPASFRVMSPDEASEHDFDTVLSDARPIPESDAESTSNQALVLHGPDDDDVKSRINERFFVLKQLCWAAADGEVQGLVVSGPPGVGKSFEVEQALEYGENAMADVMGALTKTVSDSIDPDTPPAKLEHKEKIRYTMIGGHVAPLALYETLYRYSDSRSVVVFDDCDSVLFDEKSLNLLKKALDSGSRRVLDWGSSALRNGDIPERFTFNGSVIFISNIDFERPKVKSSQLAEHLQAIMSRVYYVDLTMHSMRDKFLRIEQVAKDFGLLQKTGLIPEHVDEVMAFFEENIMNFREVSIRTVQKIATMRRLNECDWRNLSKITTFKTTSQ
jgi:hypothetical protein